MVTFPAGCRLFRVVFFFAFSCIFNSNSTDIFPTCNRFQQSFFLQRGVRGLPKVRRWKEGGWSQYDGRFVHHWNRHFYGFMHSWSSSVRIYVTRQRSTCVWGRAASEVDLRLSRCEEHLGDICCVFGESEIPSTMWEAHNVRCLHLPSFFFFIFHLSEWQKRFLAWK